MSLTRKAKNAYVNTLDRAGSFIGSIVIGTAIIGTGTGLGLWANKSAQDTPVTPGIDAPAETVRLQTAFREAISSKELESAAARDYARIETEMLTNRTAAAERATQEAREAWSSAAQTQQDRARALEATLFLLSPLPESELQAAVAAQMAGPQASYLPYSVRAVEGDMDQLNECRVQAQNETVSQTLDGQVQDVSTCLTSNNLAEGRNIILGSMLGGVFLGGGLGMGALGLGRRLSRRFRDEAEKEKAEKEAQNAAQLPKAAEEKPDTAPNLKL